MNAFHVFVLNFTHKISSAQARGDDYQSVAATLVHEKEKNKLSPIERAWVAGTM
jgi:hypothetical protein